MRTVVIVGAAFDKEKEQFGAGGGSEDVERRPRERRRLQDTDDVRLRRRSILSSSRGKSDG